MIKSSLVHTLVARIRYELRLVVYFHQEHAKISTTTSLISHEQRLRTAIKNVDGGIPVFLLDVAGCDDSELLVCFVELAFCNPGQIISSRV